MLYSIEKQNAIIGKPVLIVGIVAATWRGASKYIGGAWELMQKGGSPEDAVEYAIARIEDDPEEHTVGYNSCLNEFGQADLDAAFMEGSARRIGAVAMLNGCRNPIKVARLVMEKTPHNLLVGAGADAFADKMGCEKRDMVGPYGLAEYIDRRDNGIRKEGHDTVGVIAMHAGHIACGMSTSGFLYRMKGRVSDSAIPACGYFCDDAVGGVVCTGVGEDIMRAALAAKAFFYMESGIGAEEAAVRAIRDVHSRIKGLGRVALVTMDVNGHVGYGANHEIFCCSYTDERGCVRVDDVPYCFAGENISVGEEVYL